MTVKTISIKTKNYTVLSLFEFPDMPSILTVRVRDKKRKLLKETFYDTSNCKIEPIKAENLIK